MPPLLWNSLPTAAWRTPFVPNSPAATSLSSFRIWELRHNFTAYDATYIALAEATNSVLYTSDDKLRKGHRARVAVFTL